MAILDGFVILIIFFSAFLAMIRGFFREVFSLLAWVSAGGVSFLLYEPALPFLGYYISDRRVAFAVTLVVIFLTTLFVLSTITMKLADIIANTYIGALDRSLGFIFGTIRGVLVVSIVVLFVNNLVEPSQQHAWIGDSRTKPIFDVLSAQIWDLLPKRIFNQLYRGVKEFEKKGTVK